MIPNPDTVTEPPRPSRWIKLPAILAVLFCLVMGVSLLTWNPDTVRSRYRIIARVAIDKKDYPTALVAASRLLSFGGESRNEALLLLAQANLGAGHNAEAAGILQTVAPLDKAVYAPAHLFVARTLLARSNRSMQMDQAIGTQIRNAITLQPESAEANELLARWRSRDE